MRIKALGVIIVLLLVATPSWGWFSFFSSQKDDELVEIFEEIETEGPSKESVQALEGYITRNFYKESTDEAMLRLGRIYTQLKDPSKAAATYERLLDSYPGSGLKHEAMLELGALRYRNGQTKEAKDLVSEVSSNSLATASLRARARVLLKEIDSAMKAATILDTDAPAIGAILPLKGNYSKFAEAALRGILLASGAFGDRPSPVTVYVRDLGNSTESALSAAEELERKSNVLGIVGPLVSATAGELSDYSQKKKLPLVLLSQKRGAASGGYVFRNFLTPEEQASAIAGYAVEKLGLKRFAVLHPQNNYGVELADLFEKEASSRGGNVITRVSYPRGTKDFSSQLTSIFGIEYKEKKEGRRRIKEYTPTIMVDAVFIPDYYDAVSLIAPYFEYYNIKDVKLLGANGWNSPGLVEKAGKHLEGAVFVDGFFSGSLRPGSAEFTERFRKAYGVEPGVIEAQAYDAAMVLISSIEKGLPDGIDRYGLKKRIEEAPEFIGAEGAISFDSRGEAVRKLFLLTVKEGRITEAVPAE